MDGFPHGRFKELVTVIRPGILGGSEREYLGHYEALLEDLRRERDSGYGSYPYPIYPEKGGLLPWGDTPYGQLLSWLTDNEDPDTWPVVWADRGEEQWHLNRQSLSEFLLQLVTDPPAELVELAGRDLAAMPAFRSFDTANVVGSPGRSAPTMRIRRTSPAPTRSGSAPTMRIPRTSLTPCSRRWA